MSRLIRLFVCLFALSGLVQASPSSHAFAQETPAKKKVTSDADLPRFSYPLTVAPSDLLVADDATFGAFMQKVSADVESVLSGYEIEDKATLRSLVSARLNVQMLSGDRTGALATIDRLRDLQEKPADRATVGIGERAILQAWTDTGTATGPAFEEAYKKNLASAVSTLPWDTVQDTMKSWKTWTDVLTLKLLIGQAKSRLDPNALKTQTLDFDSALQMLDNRMSLKFALPLNPESGAVVTSYVKAHNVLKPDIWPAREVTLAESDKLTPVLVGIWDSGVDTSLYPGQLYTDPAPGPHSPHGLAFDTDGKIYAGDLQPLTAEQKDAYPKVLRLNEGSFDNFSLIDSPAAAEFREWARSTPPDEMAKFSKTAGFLGQWMHGTHVAGIAVRGNAAARLVVTQFNDALPDLPFAPTVEWANRFKADFLQIGDYFREHHVRVVNMSWDDDVSEIETWLSKTSTEKDPAAREHFAEQIYAIWRDGVETAIRNTPDTLFVCAAGNSNSNAGFLGDVPASLHLPNLISVGAVDQAGEETSFTSYGDTVVLHADGFQVESFVPGGKRLKFSGTSMASPNVVNLAAKLFALDPSLTPQQAIALMEKGADTSANGRLHLINSKATVALLKQPAN